MKFAYIAAALSLFSTAALAGPETFTDGPVIEGYGKVAPGDALPQLDPDLHFKIAFDLVEASGDTVSRRINSAARFLNMHARAGVKPENIELVFVVHGKATLDMTKAGADGSGNPNAELIGILLEHGVRFIVCGQSAVAQDVSQEDMLPGIEIEVSAMTAHALLQQDGYTLNP